MIFKTQNEFFSPPKARRMVIKNVIYHTFDIYFRDESDRKHFLEFFRPYMKSILEDKTYVFASVNPLYNIQEVINYIERVYAE